VKLIILDRDGVINYDSDAYIKHPDEWVALPGSLEAIGRLTRDGWRVVVATNQSGVGRQLFDMQTLNQIHSKFRQQVIRHGGRIDAIFVCPHHPDEACDCRKPRPGLFQQIASRFDINLDQTIAVGDSLRDLQAGASVGCQPWLVRTGNGTHTQNDPALPKNTYISDNLESVVNKLLGN